MENLYMVVMSGGCYVGVLNKETDVLEGCLNFVIERNAEGFSAGFMPVWGQYKHFVSFLPLVADIVEISKKAIVMQQVPEMDSMQDVYMRSKAQILGLELPTAPETPPTDSNIRKLII